MVRRFCVLGFAGLAVLLLTPNDLLAKDRVRFVVVEVQDELEKYSYHAMEERAADKFITGRVRLGEKREEQWKELSREEKREAPEPERVKAKIKKRNLKSIEEAREVAGEYLSKVPERLRAEGEGGGEKAKKPAKESKAKAEAGSAKEKD